MSKLSKGLLSFPSGFYLHFQFVSICNIFSSYCPGLDILESVMLSKTVSAFGTDYSIPEPMFSRPDKIPSLESSSYEKPAPLLPILGNINVNDLFAKLVATGIVQVKDTKVENGVQEQKKVEEKNKPKEDKNVIHKVDLMRIETLRV